MPNARTSDPHPSREAAASVSNVTETQQVIISLLTVESMTDEMLVTAYQSTLFAPQASESGIRSRRAELVRRGAVVDTGARRKLQSGRNAIVWAVAS